MQDTPTDSNVSILKIRDCIKSNFNTLVNQIMKFAERIPGFSSVGRSDVQILLEECTFEMWMVRKMSFFRRSLNVVCSSFRLEQNGIRLFLTL